MDEACRKKNTLNTQAYRARLKLRKEMTRINEEKKVLPNLIEKSKLAESKELSNSMR